MIIEPVKIAVIGCGGYAFHLIRRTLSIPYSGVITAVTSRDPNSSGAAYCRDQGIPVFQTVDALLDFGKFDVVINPTPIHLHSSITRQCLSAGFPVWMEKPPVATVQELDALQAASDRDGLPIAVCFNSLYSGLTQQLKRELVAGRYGRVRLVKGIGAWIRDNHYFTRNNWAGKILQNGQWILDGDVNNPFAHILCNNLYFAAPDHHALAEPETVLAELYRCNAIESEDTSCLRIITREGVEVINWLTLGPEREITPCTVVETEKALITFKNFNRLLIEFYDGETEEREAYQEDRIEMISHLCRAFRTGEPYWAPLKMMRPFTVSVNGAFDSAGTIHSIPSEFLQEVAMNSGNRIYIKGVVETMEKAFESNSLFSEIGVPWAREGQQFDTREYGRFPNRFKLSPGEAAT